MYFKCVKDTPTFKAFSELIDKGRMLEVAAVEFMEKEFNGAKRARPIDAWLGGIGAIQFLESEPPVGWVQVDAENRLYKPPADEEVISNMEYVTHKELMALLNLEPYYIGNNYIDRVGIRQDPDGVFAYHTHLNPNYVPPDDIIEITGTEFLAVGG